MANDSDSDPAFVIKPDEIAALNYLSTDHPSPKSLEWINRASDKKLRRSSIDMLLRTLHRDVTSPSVVRLHQESGLRVLFRSERDRNAFAKAFAAAKEEFHNREHNQVTALFSHQDEAECAIKALIDAGIPEDAISLMARADQFVEPIGKWPQGHSKMSILASATGGGFAGLAVSISVMLIPGFGLLALGGGLAASAVGSFAAASSVFGATGGAIARMLTDHDVDGVSATLFQEQVRKGKIFVSVDARVAEGKRQLAREILKKSKGRTRTSN